MTDAERLAAIRERLDARIRNVMRGSGNGHTENETRKVCEDAQAELTRLSEWADGFDAAAMKERQLADQRIKELSAENDRLSTENAGLAAQGEKDKSAALNLIARIEVFESEQHQHLSEIDLLSSEIAALRRDIDEALMLTEGCSTLKDMAAWCVRGAQAEVENAALRKVLERLDSHLDFGEPIEHGAIEQWGDTASINEAFAEAHGLLAASAGDGVK